METFDHVLVTAEGAVAILTLNQPEILNAVSAAMMPSR